MNPSEDVDRIEDASNEIDRFNSLRQTAHSSTKAASPCPPPDEYESNEDRTDTDIDDLEHESKSETRALITASPAGSVPPRIGGFSSNTTPKRTRSGSTRSEIFKRDSAQWGQAINVLLDSHSRTSSIDVSQYTINKHGKFSWFSRYLRWMGYSKDLYVRLTLMSTKEAQQTKTVFGVAKSCMFGALDRNHQKFFIPTSMVDEQHLRPIKMLAELWNKDMYSSDDFISSNVVDIRPVMQQTNTQRKLQLKLRDGNQLNGTLTMKVSYTETLSVKDHELLRQKLKRKEKLRHKLGRKMTKEAKSEWHEMILKKSVREHQMTYGLVEVEILRFDGRQKDESFWKLYSWQFTSMFVVFFWLFLFAALWTYLEGWPYVTSLYFVVVVSATIGYGDYVPSSVSSKVVCSIFVMISGLMVFVAVTSLIHKIIEIRSERIQRKKESRKRREQMMERVSEAAELKRQLRAKERRQTTLALDVDNPEYGLDRRTTLQQLTALGVVPKEQKPKQGNTGYVIPYALIWITWMIIWILHFTLLSQSPISFIDALYFGIVTSGYVFVYFRYFWFQQICFYLFVVENK